MAGCGTRGNSRGGRGKRSGNGWEAWGGYMEAKRQKLNDQFEKNLNVNEKEAGPCSNIFKGIAIHVDGYTKPSSDELKRIMKQHGGQYEHYLYKTRVTHIIATSIADTKIKNDFKHCKVVKPEWITESVKAGRLLSYIPFQLYTNQTKHQLGMASYSTSAITRQTSVASTLARMSDTTENSEILNDDDMSVNNETVKINDLENNDLNFESVTPSPISDINDTDSDSCDNEFGRLMSESRNFKQTELMKLKTSFDKSENQISTNSEVEVIVSDNAASNNPNFSMIQACPAENEEETAECLISDITQMSEVKQNQTKLTNRGMALAGEPEFISEFYNNSRLHHLSTWKSEFKSYVNELQKQGTAFVGRQKLREFIKHKSDNMYDRGIHDVKVIGKPEKVIMHVDMDCFFVSVGLRKRPDLRGKPIAVTHSRGKGVKLPAPGSDPQYEFEQWKERKLQKGRGEQRANKQLTDDETLNDSWNVVGKTSDSFHSMSEIASCSYEARQAGVKNGMFMGKAKSLCPELVTIPYDFEGYNEVSRLLYDNVASYTHDIEAVSCDEMLVDCTDLLSDTGADPLDFATMLRQEIYEKTKCSASAGIGSNILQAKMATKKAKPNGQYHLKSTDVIDFMKEQPVNDIPGVGWSMSRRLQSMSVSTCGDLQNLSLGVLQKEFGPKTGQSLYKYCRGQDDRQIKLEQERKSVSAEINYGIRFKNDSDADKFLTELSEEVHNRLKKIGMKGKTVTLKLMVRREDAPIETAKFMGHGLCNSISKSSTLPLATDDPKIIAKECLTILRNQHIPVQDLRGVGIQLQRLESAELGNKPVKGPASILNFTVSKQDIAKPAINQSNLTITSNDQHRKNNTTLTKDVPSIGQKKSNDNLMKQFLINTNKVSSTSRTSEAEDTVKDKESNVFNVENLTKKNRSVLQRNTNCSYTAQNIVEDISSRRNPLIIPPLPTLNIDTSPSVIPDDPLLPRMNFETTLSSKTIIPVAPVTPESTRNRTGTSNDYFPSPSQIDPQVLLELPADIRQQIETEIRARKKSASRPTAEKDSGSLKTLPSRDEPGCSHWTAQAVTEPIHYEDNSVIVPLPSLSQLDESCFSALPEDIQREIKFAYGHQSSKSLPEDQKSPDFKKNQNFVKLTSPPKNKSPGRGKKNSPVFKVPKGRPGRGRPKKLEFASRKQPKIDTVVSGKKCLEIYHSNFITISDDPIIVDIEQNIGIPVPMKTSCVVQENVKASTVASETMKAPINLCGAVSITEVRTLLKEWLQTCHEPEKDDEDMMKDYLTSLVLDHNLEQVDLVIKFLNRHVKRLNSSTWMIALDRILNSVQTVVTGLYGSCLKL